MVVEARKFGEYPLRWTVPCRSGNKHGQGAAIALTQRPGDGVAGHADDSDVDDQHIRSKASDCCNYIESVVNTTRLMARIPQHRGHAADCLPIVVGDDDAQL